MERPTREFALQLMASKDKMESDLLELLQVLASVRNSYRKIRFPHCLGIFCFRTTQT